uniref:Eukaryotic translation initiation factor 3 subunit H n=2 Tax=Acrobeloides nanus TaxID=290746 RepID=A0A914BW20_9BILA
MAALAEAKVDVVQIDSLVVMKIVKHVDSEFYSGMTEVAGETCSGILTGLISMEEKKLEVTNCFATPRSESFIEGEETNQIAVSQVENKQEEVMEMLRRFRSMNIDYELVGFYQAHFFGACFTHEMVESLVDYQSSVQDGVCLIYDPVKTRQGKLSLHAYRLSKKALDLCVNTDWSPEVVKQAGLTYETMLEELPIVIKNSHLMNVMLAELALTPKSKPGIHLELGTRRSLEKCLRSIMFDIDELNKALANYNKYTQDKQKFDTMYNSLIQKRQLENEARVARGEAPIPLEDIKKSVKAPQLQTKNGMMEIFLDCCDTSAYADYAAEVTGENVAKLFLSEAFADNSSKDRSASIPR